MFSGLLSAFDGAEEVAEPASVSQAAPTNPLNPMLALQEMPEEEFLLKQAVRQGKSMIDALEDIRYGLLGGTLPISTLARLEGLVQQQRATTSDPRLQSILDDIELRAAVELAKLEMAGKPR